MVNTPSNTRIANKGVDQEGVSGKRPRDSPPETSDTSKQDKEHKQANKNRKMSISERRKLFEVEEDKSDETLCKECKIVVEDSDEAVQCYDCENWKHRECINMDKAEYDAICKVRDEIEYTCQQCRANKGSRKKLNEELRRENKELRAEYELLKERMRETEQLMDTKVKEMQKNILEEIKRTGLEKEKDSASA